MAADRAAEQRQHNADPSTDDALGAGVASTIFARLHPTAYLARFLTNNIRPDGRKFDQVRAVQTGKAIVVSTSDGSCLIRLGDTVCIAGVKVELMNASDEEFDDDEDAEQDAKTQHRALRGLGPVDRRRLVVGVDLAPMSSARFKSGPPGEEAQVLASRLMRTLDSCPPVSANSLLINRELSYFLHVDIVCIAYDGNVLDACMLAINGALQNVGRLPSLDAQPSSAGEGQGPPLQILSCPLSFSFAVIDNVLLSDPNAFESSMTSSTITISLDALQTKSKRDLVQVQCSGLCAAQISAQEALEAGIQPTDDESDSVLVKDEDLIKVCIHRARKQSSLFKEALELRQS